MRAPRLWAALSLLLLAPLVQAGSVDVVGLFPGKAVLIVDGANPKTYSVGTIVTGGTRLVAVTETAAILEEHGKRLSLPIGSHFSRTEAAGGASVTLQADGRGHFMTPVQINGMSTPMLVDTGATLVMLSSDDARRLGIDYKNGQRAYVNTANGRVPAFQVRLNSLRVGDIELSQVDALVQETGLPFGLLGMSFLNRTQMRRDGEQMVLTKRY